MQLGHGEGRILLVIIANYLHREYNVKIRGEYINSKGGSGLMSRPIQSKPPRDLTGEIFGMLEVLDEFRRKGEKWEWKTECLNCNTISWVRDDHMKTGHTKSCGCMNYDKDGRPLITDRRLKLLGDVYRDIIRGHVKKESSREKVISLDEVISLSEQKCIYCGEDGFKTYRDRSKKSNYTLIITGIDRLQNDIGYRSDNVVPACQRCNVMKCENTVLDFSVWVFRVFAKQKLGKTIFSELNMPCHSIIKVPSYGTIRKEDRDGVWLQWVFSGLKSDAKKMKRQFELTPSHYRKLVKEPCSFCGRPFSRVINDTATGRQITFNSVDRIDHQKGYVEGNMEPACVFCNNGKNTLSVDEFTTHVLKLVPFASNFLKYHINTLVELGVDGKEVDLMLETAERYPIDVNILKRLQNL